MGGPWLKQLHDNYNKFKDILSLAVHKNYYKNPHATRFIVEEFHKIYHSSYETTWENTFWLGVPLKKCPLDLWIYQEIIFEVRPDIIIECGTYLGGSAFYLASICELINNGKIITVDIKDIPGKPHHDRITYLIGFSTSEEIVGKIKYLIKSDDKIMVILDSDHHKDHVLKELQIYGEMVSPGSFLVVEDTQIGHPVAPNFGPGPMEAVEEFLQTHKEFCIDPSREKFFFTFNPRGYLQKRL
jgi:cephalosporin hydroxylase